VNATRKPRTIGYRQITGILVGEIQNGVWTTQNEFPTEMELVERFGVGRNTVREALRELQDLGYIRRRRGARSVLATATPDSTFVNAVHSANELLDYAKVTRFTLLATETIRVDPALSRMLEVEAGSEWVRIGLLRNREGQSAPLCYSEVYVAPAYAGAIADFENEGELFAAIERRYHIVVRRIEQEIEAILADANIASRLDVPIGSPALRVRTRFFSADDELVEIGVVNFPASRYKVRLSLDRRAPPVATNGD
jgi:DNA-binding GntR family transcriptional regulator